MSNAVKIYKAMTHYFLETQSEDVRRRAVGGALSGPEFVGQGCTHNVGSDSYGYYVAEIVKPGRVVALVVAECEWAKSWMEGRMTCSMPTDLLLKHAVSGMKTSSCFEYIVRYGRSWYWGERTPDGEIKRIPREKACLSWNGCYSYRNPSF